MAPRVSLPVSYSFSWVSRTLCPVAERGAHSTKALTSNVDGEARWGGRGAGLDRSFLLDLAVGSSLASPTPTSTQELHLGRGTPLPPSLLPPQNRIVFLWAQLGVWSTDPHAWGGWTLEKETSVLVEAGSKPICTQSPEGVCVCMIEAQVKGWGARVGEGE